MPTVVVDYGVLENVQVGYNNLADDTLEAYTELEDAQNTIEDIGSGHDNLWSGTLNSINDERRSLNSSIEDVRDLSDKTGDVSTAFGDSEGQIVNNINDIANYFGLDPTASYNVTQNTRADVSSDAQSIQASYSSASSPSIAKATGATTVTSPATTAVVTRMNNTTTETNAQTTSTIEEPRQNEEKQEEKKKEEPKEDTINKKAQEEQVDVSRDIKESSTYKQAKENAEEVSQKSSTKNISTAATGVAGATTTGIGSATEAASNIGKTTNTSPTNKKDDITQNETVEGVPKQEEVKGQAAGDIIDDDFVINDDQLETASGTHQTSPIDVTIDKNTPAEVIPALAGVAAAGLTGIGAKAVLDKQGNEDDDDENEKEEETFNGDYTVAGEEDDILLDNSDDIGFNPETIIEEDENMNQSGLEKDVYPQSVLQDMQNNEELM